MAGAGAITHSMVPPTPGPLMIADGLKIELGIAMVAGLAASVLPAWVVLVMARRFNDRLHIPMRETPGASHQDLQSIVDQKDDQLPGLFVSSIPVAFPVVVISLVSIFKTSQDDGFWVFPHARICWATKYCHAHCCWIFDLHLCTSNAAKPARIEGKAGQGPFGKTGISPWLRLESSS